MPRKKHGRYDAEKQLPDNTMQPKESGLYVWLQEQIINVLGNEQAQMLIDESRTHKTKRYTWLLEQMQVRGCDDLIAEYHKRRLADAAQRRLREKQWRVANYRQQLEQGHGDAHNTYLRKQIEKLERYIQERSEQ